MLEKVDPKIRTAVGWYISLESAAVINIVDSSATVRRAKTPVRPMLVISLHLIIGHNNRFLASKIASLGLSYTSGISKGNILLQLSTAYA